MHADAEEGTATGVAVAGTRACEVTDADATDDTDADDADDTRACEATDADAGVFTGAATYADVNGTGTETIDAAYVVECMGSVGMGETAEDIGSDWGAEGGNDGGAESSGG
jgi:hypothetical protein